ncbi:MAG: hypothetical protein KF716_32155 [Anaerolineae bacterium]|nr:hypothetical protein [Anaerolineae bacterium]
MRLFIVSLVYLFFASMCTVVVFAQEYNTPIQQTLREFEAAKAKWEADPLAHYRIRVRNGTGARTCEQDIEVRDEQVIRVFTDTCRDKRKLTITSLFDTLDKLLPRTTRWANRFQCDVWMSRSTFDPEWGFPRLIDVRMEVVSPLNLGALKYGRLIGKYFGHSRQCNITLVLFVPQVEVVAFTPLS